MQLKSLRQPKQWQAKIELPILTCESGTGRHDLTKKKKEFFEPRKHCCLARNIFRKKNRFVLTNRFVKVIWKIFMELDSVKIITARKYSKSLVSHSQLLQAQFQKIVQN